MCFLENANKPTNVVTYELVWRQHR